MTNQRQLRVAGLAGGVGTTVLSTILGADDLGVVDDEHPASNADILVARNDFRSASALLRCGVSAEQLVVLVREPNRTLTTEDFVGLVPCHVVTVDLDPSIGRADDADLLGRADWVAIKRYRSKVLALVATGVQA